MNVYGQLISAQLEILPSHPANAVLGRAYYNSTNNTVYYYDGINWQTVTSTFNKVDATTPPTVTNDSLEGYEVSSLWVDTVENKTYICVDTTAGAAVWLKVQTEKNNYTAVVDPTESNDNTEGYEVGSVWINTADEKSFTCVNSSTGAAVWSEGGGSGVGSPSLYLFLDADSTKATDFTSNLVTGTFTEDTTEANNKRYKLTNAVGASGDVEYSHALFSDARSRRTHICKIYNSDYTGTKGNVTLVIEDQASNVLDTIVIDPTAKTQQKIFHVPDTVTSIVVKPTIVTGEVATWTFDKIAFDYSPFGEASLEKRESGYATGQASNSSFATVEKNGADLFNITTSRVDFKSSCFANLAINWYDASGTSGTSMGYLHDSEGNVKMYLPGKYNGNQFGVAMTFNAEVHSGWYFTFGMAGSNAAWPATMSVTASATQDYVLVEDEREQAHFVGKAIYNLNGLWPTTSTTYVLPSFTLSSSSLSGDLIQNTALGPSVTIPKAKIGTYIVNVTGALGDTGANTKYLALYDGINYVSEQTIRSGRNNDAVFVYENTTEGALNLDIVFKVDTSTGYIQDYAPFEMSVSYLPPSDQATQPIVLSAPKQYENDYDVDVSSAGVLSNTNGGNWINSITHTTNSGVYTFEVNQNIFTVLPKISSLVSGNSAVNLSYDSASVYPNIKIVARNNAGTLTDTYFQLGVKKSSLDRRDAGVIGVGNVTPTKVMIVEDRQPSGTNGGTGISATWTTRRLSTLSGDIFGSLSLNQVTIPAGEYDIEISSPAYDCNGHICRLRDIKNGVTLLSSRNAYATDGFSDVSEAIGKKRLTLHQTTVVELQYWMSVAGGTVVDLGVPLVTSGEDEIYGTIKITKLS